MCGILGTVQRGSANRADVALALQRLAHRGPDDEGTYHDPESGVWLGHRRLSIIDLSASGHQPMSSRDGRMTLVFNGEIFNYRELRAELEASGYRFRGQSDTEVLLAMFAERGAAMLPRLNGMFAFALYDRQSRELTLVRDGMGIKPLYYCAHAHGFSFASELKSLLPLVPDRHSLNLNALQRYLTFLWCPGEETPVRNVFKLLPGELLTVKEGAIVSRRRWFDLPLARHDVREASESPPSCDAVLDGLRSAVHRQMVSDVPVGAFLSGGLDSSAVVALAAEHTAHIQCFTIAARGGNDAGDVPDLPYARRVADHLRVPLEVVHIDASSMAGDLERMVYMLDEPLADPAPLNVLYISQLARRCGVKVLLSGAGGDDLFSGYRRHLSVQLDALWNYAPQAVRTLAMRIADLQDQRRPLARRLAKLIRNGAKPAELRLAGYFCWTPDSQVSELFSAEVRAALSSVRAEQPLVDFLAEVPTSRSPIERLLSLEQRFFLADHNLPYTDKMSMAAGVEVRVPFLDRDLVRLASRVRDRDKLRGTTAKWILKKAMEGHLPRDVIYRPKTGFGAPVRRWMRGELRELLHDLCSEPSLRRRGIFDPRAVQRLIAANDAGRTDASYTLLSILCIEIWCRAFLDAPSGLYERAYGSEGAEMRTSVNDSSSQMGRLLWTPQE